MTFADDLPQPCPLPYGTRVQLVEMRSDPDGIPEGTQGTVVGGTSRQIWVHWDTSTRRNLVPGTDEWTVIG